MAMFKNRRSGETFTVADDQVDAFAARPGHYEPVDVWPCEQCDRTFDSPQGLAAHIRSHD
jgi:hypothetical protein